MQSLTTNPNVAFHSRHTTPPNFKHKQRIDEFTRKKNTSLEFKLHRMQVHIVVQPIIGMLWYLTYFWRLDSASRYCPIAACTCGCVTSVMKFSTSCSRVFSRAIIESPLHAILVR
eukprot:m.358763 g.358763  ORF g.358763 m.358763 type:complete len:115 (+) comp18269_c0_seq1:203-547(+)